MATKSEIEIANNAWRMLSEEQNCDDFAITTALVKATSSADEKLLPVLCGVANWIDEVRAGRMGG